MSEVLPIKAIVVDDEFPARENLKFMLEDFCPEVEVVGTADGVESAVALFEKERPELIFLDIRMPSGSEGFELVKRLEGNNFYVVFVTAFKEYAIRAFENRALHYILKPIDESDLRETVSRLLQRRLRDQNDTDEQEAYRTNLQRIESEINRQGKPRRITIHHSRGVKIVDPEEIVYVEGSGNCSVLHFDDGSQYLDTRTLKIYEVLLDAAFYRVHKSFIINLKQVDEILHGDDQAVVLKSGKQMPIARDRKKELLNRIAEMG